MVVILLKLAGRKAKGNENLDFVYTPAQVAKKADKTLKLLEFLSKQDQTVAPAILREQATATFFPLHLPVSKE